MGKSLQVLYAIGVTGRMAVLTPAGGVFRSGVGALRFPLVNGVLIQFVAAVVAFFLGAAAFAFLSFFATVTQV
jgi:hypothetical protein